MGIKPRPSTGLRREATTVSAATEPFDRLKVRPVEVQPNRAQSNAQEHVSGCSDWGGVQALSQSSPCSPLPCPPASTVTEERYCLGLALDRCTQSGEPSRSNQRSLDSERAIP
jgi:hypothetical protein